MAPLNFTPLWLSRLGNGDGLARIAYFESGKAADGDVLTQLADLGGDQLRDRDGLVFDEGLLEQAHFLVELFHLAGDHLLRDVRGLPLAIAWARVDVLLAGEVSLR